MKKKLYKDHFEIRDARSRSAYRVDDEYLNGYAKLCGVYSTAIYNSLCRHADNYQQAFPSIELMAEQHNLSRPTVIKAIKRLEEYGIIKVIKTKDKKTKRQLPNIYVLIDKSMWKGKPSKRRLPRAESISFQSRVNEVYCKDTHIRNINNTEEIQRIKSEISSKFRRK